MGFKVVRLFAGGYTPDHTKLAERKYIVIPNIGKRMIAVSNSNQGFGKVDGHVYKLGKEYYPVPVCLFRRDNRQLLWETTSKADGSYSFRNVALGIECFIVAFDPNNQHKPVIQGKILPFDGRTG